MAKLKKTAAPKKVAEPAQAADAYYVELQVGYSVSIAPEFEAEYPTWAGRIGTVELIENPESGVGFPLVDVQFPKTAHQSEAYAELRANELVKAEAAQPAAPTSHHALQYVPLASIDIVRNTRSSYDEAALQELTESIRVRGVIQPVSLRPHPQEAGRYQLAAGHRRFMASQRAGLLDIPASIQAMTDHEFLEIQVLENLQREAIEPADEAAAFAELLAHEFSAEEIAARVGKSPKFVLQRAKLAALVPFWMTALREHRLPLVAAHELARLPEAAQEQVTLMKDEYGYAHTDKTVYKPAAIRKFIDSEILRDLHTVAFPKDDPSLNPAMGACTTCPHRTGAMQLLFEEMNTGKDCCLNPGCFALKKERFVQRRFEELTEQNGQAPIRITQEWNTKAPGVVPRNDYQVATAGAKTTEVLVVDGADAGQLKHVVLSSRAQPMDLNQVADQQRKEKEAEAAKIRANRLQRVTNELLAEHMRDVFTEGLLVNGDAAQALLVHFTAKAMLYGRSTAAKETLDYLQKRYGFAAPVDQDLNIQYRNDGPNLHESYLRRELAKQNVLDLVTLFFDLKFRERMIEEMYDNQQTLARQLPGGAPNVKAEAEALLVKRFYTPRGKKGNDAPELLGEVISKVMAGEEVANG